MEERKIYEAYTADALALILKSLGSDIKRYTDFIYKQESADNRSAEEIALERAANMGLEVI